MVLTTQFMVLSALGILTQYAPVIAQDNLKEDNVGAMRPKLALEGCHRDCPSMRIANFASKIVYRSTGNPLPPLQFLWNAA